MKVSIITPCYNASPYIANTIASVQAQTLADWEMLIIDDGSTDNSADIIRQIAASDSRVKLIQKTNGGSASARNLGLSIAKGEYIQFLDADDTLAIDKLERQTTLMAKEELEVSYTDFYMMNADGSIQERALGKNFNLSKLLVGWGPLGTIPPHAFLYHHHFLKKNNISFTTDIREREDWDFHIKVFSAQPAIKRIKGYCGAYYYLCPTGKTTSGNQEKVHRGTVRYLQYKIQQMQGGCKLLLQIRLSLELIAITRCAMRKSMELANIRPQLAKHKWQTALAIALLPIALPIYTYTWIQSRIKK